MDKEFLAPLTAIVISLISLIGVLSQYFFPAKKTEQDKDYDMAKTLDTITEAYDKLFKQLNIRITFLETEEIKNKEEIRQLTALRIKLEKIIQEQKIEIERLKSLLHLIKKESI
jgi:hypothetical protein